MTALAVIGQRLRGLADDSDKRASESDSVEAIRLYRLAALDARHAAVALHMGERMRREALARCEALATAARSYDGESIAQEQPACSPPAPIIAMPKPSGPLLNARQLAAMFGVGEKRARRAIERCYRRGLPGFHRDGALWFAEHEAFARMAGSVRIVSATHASGTQAT